MKEVLAYLTIINNNTILLHHVNDEAINLMKKSSKEKGTSINLEHNSPKYQAIIVNNKRIQQESRKSNILINLLKIININLINFI